MTASTISGPMPSPGIRVAGILLLPGMVAGWKGMALGLSYCLGAAFSGHHTDVKGGVEEGRGLAGYDLSRIPVS
jgi:hypothetical protein